MPNYRYYFRPLDWSLGLCCQLETQVIHTALDAGPRVALALAANPVRHKFGIEVICR